MSHFIRLFLVEFRLVWCHAVLLEMAGWQEIGEGIRNQHSGNLTLNLGKNSSNAQRGPVFGYLGNEYSGKLKFNVGRNSSNAQGSSSGINCFAPYAPQSLTPNCLQSWSEGNGNQQSENLKFNLGKNSSNAPRSTRVLLLILPESSAPWLCAESTQTHSHEA